MDWMLSNRRLLDTNFSNVSDDCTPTLAFQPVFILALRICVSITSILSMLGASLIIGTFIAFKSLRTKARQLLVQLSIADFLLALSHLVGVNLNLPRFASRICSNRLETDYNITGDAFCEVQAGISIFSTLGSFFWTVAVALYLLTIIVFEKPKVGKYLTYLSYVVCWGVPAVVVVIFGTLNYLGFHANLDAGWCYLRTTFKSSPTVPDVLSQVFVYLTYILLFVLYVWIRCSIRAKMKYVSTQISSTNKFQSRRKNADIKLTFIPLFFIFLRIWGTFLGIFYIYVSTDYRAKFRETPANAALIFLSGIGTSAQGLVNALLFCVLTSLVRKRLTHAIKYNLCCCCFHKKEQTTYLLEPSTEHSATGREETTHYDNEDMWTVPSPSYNAITRTRLQSESLDGSKFNSASVGKRVVSGTE